MSKHVRVLKEETAGDFDPSSALVWVCVLQVSSEKAGFIYWSEFSFAVQFPLSVSVESRRLIGDSF